MAPVSGIPRNNTASPLDAPLDHGPSLIAPREIEELRARIDARLAGWLAAQRDGYLRQPLFAPLYDDLEAFVTRPGKRLRSLIFLVAHRILSGGPAAAGISPDLLAVGVSLELLHGFILIHDDIIDRSDVRRASPTLHRLIEQRLPSFTDRGRAGGNLALVLGDILFGLAQKCLLESGLPPETRLQLSARMLHSIVDTGFGEVSDVLHGVRDVSKVSLSEIEQTYLLKTTRYTLEGPLAMAGIAAGCGAAEMEAITRFARPAGLAFQIENDLKEFSRFEISDADVPGDIIEGKKTMLIRMAFELLDEPDRGLLQLCLGSPLSEGTISKVRELISKSGAVAMLHVRINELFAEAHSHARDSGLAPAVQEGLISLADLVRSAASQGKG